MPAQDARSRQGKMEKSFLSFVTTYPTWDPNPVGKRMLVALAHHEPRRSATWQAHASLPAQQQHHQVRGGSGC
jgi:autophagy-related protein 9